MVEQYFSYRHARRPLSLVILKTVAGQNNAQDGKHCSVQNIAGNDEPEIIVGTLRRADDRNPNWKKTPRTNPLWSKFPI
jgi:hypothetical protein